MQLHARGHLIDAGILGKALDTVTGGGGRYEVLHFHIGRTPREPSEVLLEVEADGAAQLARLVEDLGALGFSAPAETDVESLPAPRAGVAPEGFYSTTNLPTRVRIGGRWQRVAEQRMDAVIVVGTPAAARRAGGQRGRQGARAAAAPRCVKLRDLRRGQRVVVGHGGVSVTPDARHRERSDFAFMSSEVSSERRVEAQAGLLADLWRRTRREGRKVVLVVGPVVVHSGQADALAGLVRRGWIDALLAGNALAVHDVESALLGTSLGVSQESGQPVRHGHMNHMRAINAVRAAGGLRGAVTSGLLKRGIMHAIIRAEVPYCLAGSIRDDGPLPDTEMDLIVAQERYARLLRGAGLVIVLGSMLHGIGVGNMLPASVTLVCVDINPAVASKLADRGSSHTLPIVTDAGLFLAAIAERLKERARRVMAAR